ncbi:ATP-dependent DNA helicase RecG [Elysia marginata]|uniref:ATP-dependent DNA helicase RecG n=1 Tax=Elysia marginata TaxID=1093978 RepID=A0AAV4G703_9GAST|nr:ATP-dependent DNA helicase RecG [Elysia marginata]
MNRLLQGDVGSGKTIIAFMTMLIAIDNGFQACIVAPTEILAMQHYRGMCGFAEQLGIRISLLMGSTKLSKRKDILPLLKSGAVQILVGTHAIFENNVVFKALGVAIIDEQHRFGVVQRAKLWAKNKVPPHILIMSATPIPRTLAMSLYGDLDISLIDKLPPGRKPIKTIHKYESGRLSLFHFMKKQIALGRQIYVVYPLIEESRTLDYNNLMEGYESLDREFPKPEYQISILHGKMKSKDKEFEINRFQKVETHIMVATTVVEVGVNIPNASVMVIESAERFGLSQLHQLRGRVGRGSEQSYCILMTGFKLSKDAKTKIETMVHTNDGFEVAEVDLKLRGPGDLMGTQQSGILNLKMANLSEDQHILKLARDYAQKILSEDKDLNFPKNLPIKNTYQQIMKYKGIWQNIS